jgi:hypothetical protein
MTSNNKEISDNKGVLGSADKAFIYLGALALAALAVIAAMAYKDLNISGRNTTGGQHLISSDTAIVIVGHLDTGECFAYFDDGNYPILGWAFDSSYPSKILWKSVLPPGTNHVFQITFAEWPFPGSRTMITVDTGSSTSSPYQVAPGKDRSTPYTYTIQDLTDPCSSVIGAVGVIVQK